VPPLTKRRLSRARQGERRAHLALTAPNLVECSNCHRMRLPHTVCPHCGYYRGVEVIKVKAEKSTKKPE